MSTLATGLTSELASTSDSKMHWTEAEERYIAENRRVLTYQQMANALGRTRKSVSGHFQEMRTRQPRGRKYDYHSLPKELLAYAAGIIDGEGHIGINPSHGGKYFVLRTEVSNTCVALCEFLKDRFGGNVVAGHRPNRKPYYRWMLAARQADEFLAAVKPFMVVKAGQVDLALRFRAERDRRLHREMHEQMKLMHRYP